MSQLCASRGIKPFIQSVPAGVETTIRFKDGQEYLFVLNHNEEAAVIDLGEHKGIDQLTDRTMNGGKAELAGRDVWIIKLDA